MTDPRQEFLPGTATQSQSASTQSDPNRIRVLADQNRRIPALDGLRGLAILMVMTWHYFTVPAAQSSSAILRFLARFSLESWSGVDLFFVLSGFLIDAKGSKNFFRTFYIRRAFRILPLYATVCCLYFPYSRWVSYAFHGVRLHAMPWYVYATFTQNFWLNNDRWHVWLTTTWSLAVEEQFYLTLPLLIWITPAKQLWKLIAAAAIAVPIFRSVAFLHYYPAWLTAAYVLLPCRAEGLLLGVLAAMAFRNSFLSDSIQTKRRWLYTAAGIAVLPIALCIFMGWGTMSTAVSTVGYSALAVLYVALLVATLNSEGLLRRIFCLNWLCWLGTIAYGVYLLHVPALDFSFDFFEHGRPQLKHLFDLVPLTIALCMTLLIAHLSWVLFESRFVKLGHRFTYTKTRQNLTPDPTLHSPRTCDA